METTLFDGKGQPVAYIAEDRDNTIYLWQGQAVAYYDAEIIFGWNGKHLGWFTGGVLYNLHGHRVGSLAEQCPRPRLQEPGKYEKRAKHAKAPRYTEISRPVLSSSYGIQTLEEFLKSGAPGAG